MSVFVEDASGDSCRSSSQLPRLLWLVAAVFIVYATLFPFNFVSDRGVIAEHWSRASHNLSQRGPGALISVPATVQNVLLFLPFGFVGVISLRRPTACTARIGLVTVLAILLSATVEMLQLFTTDRTTSAADLAANSVGALLGASSVPFVTRVFDGWMARPPLARLIQVPSFYPLTIAAVLVCIAELQPFGVRLGAGYLWRKLKILQLYPWRAGAPHNEAAAVLLYVLFTMTVSLWLRDIGVKMAPWIAALIATVVGVVLEAGQLFIWARMPGAEGVVAHTSGAVAGAMVFVVWQRVGSARLWCALLAAATVLVAATQELSLTQGLIGPPSSALSHQIELVLVYFPLGFALALVSRTHRRAYGMSLLSALGIAWSIGYLQRWIEGQWPGVLDIGISVIGCALGAWFGGEVWRSVASYLSHETSSR